MNRILTCGVLLLLIITRPSAPGTEPGAGSELRYEAPKFLSGGVYGLEGTNLLFKFERVAERSGSSLTARREYTYPNGKLAAREIVSYEGDALTAFELDETQTGGKGTAKIRRVPGKPDKGSIEFEYTAQPGTKPKVHTEALRENTLIGDMVGPFLATHLDALQRGDKVKCRFIAVQRLETVGFTFVKDAEATAAAKRRDTVTIKMEPTSPFIAALVDPLFFTIEQAPPHRVRQYTGRTTPKIQSGGKWKELDAVTIFDWQSARR